jgi:hypothetical protein
LVDLVDEDEFAFVVGHEVGHFLLDHSVADLSRVDSPGHFIELRSREISADRIGLIACNSLDAGIRALMKTMSGLTGRHLRFDVAAFVSQLRKIESGTPTREMSATHPPSLIRARALIWFSLSDVFRQEGRALSSEQSKRIDERIERDLSNYVDGLVRRRIESVRQDLLLWMFALEVLNCGTFSKVAQQELGILVGEDAAQRLKTFLSSMSAREGEQLVYVRMKAARDELEGLAPSTFLSQVAEITSIVENARRKWNDDRLPAI